MKRFANAIAIPALICLIVLMIWGTQIKEFSALLYFFMMFVVLTGFISHYIQSDHDRDRVIANRAVEQYKKDNGIIE